MTANNSEPDKTFLELANDKLVPSMPGYGVSLRDIIQAIAARKINEDEAFYKLNDFYSQIPKADLVEYLNGLRKPYTAPGDKVQAYIDGHNQLLDQIINHKEGK